ncbi:MAG: DUF664 domain-containing protein [Streptosporangiales bacterium]|nr:DUF664 domain-containing protein [Streptosporangiales bacterium]
MTAPTDRVPAVLEDPGLHVSDPRELLLGHLDWYADALRRKLAGLSDAALRTPVEPIGWAPLGVVQHLGWVERRWLRWGFAAQDVVAYAPEGDEAEWAIPPDCSAADVLGAYAEEVRLARAAIGDAPLDAPARVGGRFPTAHDAPTLGRILFHLLQEYARHAGHLDVARELVDGTTGE